MKYDELVGKVKEAAKKAKISKTVGHVAFQFNVLGEAAGAFYIELTDGKVNVEPYEYYDRDVIIVTTADVVVKMIDENLQPMATYANDQIKVYGDLDQLDLWHFSLKGI